MGGVKINVQFSLRAANNQWMPDANDMDLMQEYADRNSESAFAGLVHRHINLVYSVALRFTGNSSDAQDVTRAVFIILAQKAASLRQRTTLTGWLYETTRLTARQSLRTRVNVTLESLIEQAYGVDKDRVIVSVELPQTHLDYIANVQSDSGKALQQEIRRQFGITGRLEMRETNVLVLKPSSTDIKGFKISHTMPDGGRSMIPKPGNYPYYEHPMASLIGLLEGHFQIPIIDQTGLKEYYDFALKWNEPDWKKPNLDGLKQALLDQLGLELVSTKMPIEMLVVEKAQ